MKKRKIALLLAASLLACSLVACGKKNEKETHEETTVETTEVALEEAPYEIVYSDAEVWQARGYTANRIIVAVKNTGTEDMMLLDEYYDLEDTKGRLVAIDQIAWCYPEVISPGEIGYIYNLDTVYDDYSGDYSDVVVVPKFQAVKSYWGHYDCELSSVNSAVMEDWDINVKGRIENKSDETVTTTCIYIICYDKYDNPVCIVSENIYDDIKPNEQISFEFESHFLTEEISSRIDYYEAFTRSIDYYNKK